jgi:phenylacetate-CoA ligase
MLRSNAAALQSVYNRMPGVGRDTLTTIRGLMLPRNRRRKVTRALLQELQNHEEWMAQRIRAYQLNLLGRIITHARTTCPYYASYPPFEESTFPFLCQYPVLDRECVRQNANSMISTSSSSRHRICVRTTGTTGAALNVFYDDDIVRAVWALHLRQWQWAGVNLNQPRITFFGSQVVPPGRKHPPYWTHNLFERQVLASSFHLSSSTAGDYVQFLARNRGKVIEAFPSILAVLADFVLARGAPVPMKAIFTSGEPVHPFIRERAERAFCTRVWDTYGMTEHCGLIQECEHGKMHLIPESGYLEILDESDRAVPVGTEGYFVWTGFLNTTMPLIRYRIGDRGLWSDGDACPCGRHFPVVKPTITRDSDMLFCPNGLMLSPRILNQTLKAVTNLQFCQFVRKTENELVVRAVTRSPERAMGELAALCQRVQELVGPQMHVSFELAERPMLRSGGKMPLILDAFSDQWPTR